MANSQRVVVAAKRDVSGASQTIHCCWYLLFISWSDIYWESQAETSFSLHSTTAWWLPSLGGKGAVHKWGGEPLKVSDLLLQVPREGLLFLAPQPRPSVVCLIPSRSQRLQFDVSSPNGILLFRETSKMITTYGGCLEGRSAAVLSAAAGSAHWAC